MEIWEPADVEDALELIGKSFTHTAVRDYAVSRLATVFIPYYEVPNSQASDDDLLLYLLQLVQALKFEDVVQSDKPSSDKLVPVVWS